MYAATFNRHEWLNSQDCSGWKAVFVLLLLFSSSCFCQTTLAENYDFIIAGGGTAGLALARRLAEGGKHSVLVVESGDFPVEGMDVPVQLLKYALNPELTFKFTSTPQLHSGRVNNGIITEFHGRVLGGSSNLNFMWFNRGHPRDWDNWGNLTRDSSWNYSNMLKYFKRVETYSGDYPSDQHGLSGPISVSRPKYAPGLEEWLAAGRNLGYRIADPNGPQQVCFAPAEYSKRRGRRDSSFAGYIQPIWGSLPNLRIVLNTNVTRIIFKGNRAVGVLVDSQSPLLKDKLDNILYANKEVIVSAGAFGSPLILQRSGIGPKNILRNAKIPLIKDLPVGKNFQNHVYIPLAVILNNRSAILDEEKDLTPENWEYFNKFGDGPFSSVLGTTGQAFTVSSIAKAEGESNWPDVQPVMLHSVTGYNFVNNVYGNVSMTQEEAPMSMMLFLTRPKSRGSIAVNSRDPIKGDPVWDVGYFSDRRDVDKAVEGMKILVDICESPSYKKLGARLPTPNVPACKRFPFKTKEYWRCFVRYASATGFHPAGTCRMGRGPQDPSAVVDAKLRVIGISGLRVVDASIMPRIVNANTHAAVYGIAEKAAEMILNAW